ncbi:hypothetical protein [Pseudomonas sp. SO81]|uniref:leucine-rich repeat domain-containing protein n=1 Tax=Pseudomonas sp. SO81 TaxID=2983246 RepID=UPI0025A3F23A|nr:hypothetical protein [Pseudomonas sp. SO81]WJN61119.1 hypothetical protein OH686_20430 [Pseudomonas sp. SO81]
MVTDKPFHTSRWPKSITHADQYESGTTLSLSWDLGDISDSEKKRVIAAWVKALPSLSHLTHLRVWSRVTQPLFDAICELSNLQVLQIKWSNVCRLDAIRNLSALKALSIGSSTQVESIAPLTALQSLELLEIENFKLITDFSPLVDLRSLRHLSVSGSMWSKQAAASLEPFGQMTWLSSLCVDTSNVKSLRALEPLANLKSLGIGGRLPYDEYAWLSAKLPNTECQWFQPYLDLSESGYSPCASCGEKSMVMVTGKGKPVLCRHCDDAKLTKHVGLFEQARAAAGG